MFQIKQFSKLPMATAVATLTALAALPTETSAQMLEEVVITATKRSASLQDVPIAVTAFNERTIEQAGITNVTGVALRTPGFNMGSYSAAQPLMYIRGVGSNERGAGGGEASVAMFVDGVYMSRAAGAAAEMFDMASIEVLRGPQGTLWGKNAIAGVINVKSRRPSMEGLETRLQGEVGNEGIWGINGMVNGPLGDTMAGKLTVSVKERDTWQDSVVDSKADTGDLESHSLRGQLLFAPTDTLEGLLSVDYSKDERGGLGINAQLLPGATPGGEPVNYFANLQPGIDYHETFIDLDGHQEVENSGISLQLDLDIGEMTLTSITAYRESETDMLNSSFGVGLSTFPVIAPDQFTDEESKMFSQELRLNGGGDNLEWTVGAYYFSDEIDRLEGADIHIGPLAPPLLGLPDFLVGLALTDQADQHAENESIAVFGELTWNATERLDLTFGARYSSEEKEYQTVGTGQAGLFVGNFDVDTDESWSNPTYKFVANYHLNDESMLYGSVASGFKSGGWQQLALNETAAETPFDEETAVNYELGIKSQFMDNRIRLNAALFYTDYEDLQVAGSVDDGSPIPPIITVNAGKAEISGLEMEFTWAVTEEFQLLANYAYLDTEYVELSDTLQPYEGNYLRNAPENAYNVTALYETVLSGGGELSFRYEYIYKDETEQEIQNWDQSRKPDYQLSNFRLGYTTADAAWEVAAWVKNAFDEEYLDHSYYLAGIGGIYFPAMSRTYGVTVTWANF